VQSLFCFFLIRQFNFLLLPYPKSGKKMKGKLKLNLKSNKINGYELAVLLNVFKIKQASQTLHPELLFI